MNLKLSNFLLFYVGMQFKHMAHRIPENIQMEEANL